MPGDLLAGIICKVTDQYVPTSTADVVPSFAHRVVIQSTMVWADKYDSMSTAHAAIMSWAVNNGYDAIVAVRCEIVANVYGSVSTSNMGTHAAVTGTNASKITYTMYGTAVKYQA